MRCVVVGTLQHTALLCSILSALLFLSLSLPPPITRKKHRGVERREGERSGWGKRERKRKKRGVMQKRVEKRGAKREKEITTPGVPRLSPTLVLTRPEEA